MIRILPRWLLLSRPGQLFLYHVYYRYRCPYPVIEDPSARACVEGGHCGCNNAPRYAIKR
jgi:hypothetical protein